jgi:uncharacterized membrane protein
MQGRGRRIVGLVMTAVGIVVVVIAVLLFGLTKTSNGESTVDWVSVVTAIGGIVIAGRGAYAIVRKA